MEGIIKKQANEVSPSGNISHIEEIISVINLPTLEGDFQVPLGQTIVAIIRLHVENDITYSKDVQHDFKTELMASILEELNISIDDIAKVYQERNAVED